MLVTFRALSEKCHKHFCSHPASMHITQKCLFRLIFYPVRCFLEQLVNYAPTPPKKDELKKFTQACLNLCVLNGIVVHCGIFCLRPSFVHDNDETAGLLLQIVDVL